MEPRRDDNELIAELRALRPEPSQEFTAGLDERAAAGFPRRSAPSRAALGRLATRLSEIRPRRLLVPAGATALAAVAAVAVVVALGDQQTDSVSDGKHLSDAAGIAAHPPTPAGKTGAGGRGYEPFGSSLTHYPRSLKRAFEAAPAAEPLSGGSNAFFNASGAHLAARAAQREIERSAEIVLGADPAEVGKDAARVFEAVHAQHGIVLRSSIRDGAEGEAGARFDLLIPSVRLGDALAAFTAIAEVRSRHEATADITAPTVGVAERLRDSRARIDGLLAQLSRADTDAERAAAESALRAERGRSAYLHSQLSRLQRRADFSRVSLRIETGDPSASAGAGNGGWGIGDALADAGHILAIAAGVTILALAILGPIALIALIAWLANRTRLRRARERALA